MSGLTKLQIAKVFRYHEEGFDDYGWGCVHRSLQSLYFHVTKQHLDLEEIVNSCGIQWKSSEDIPREGRRKLWIEPQDCATFLDNREPTSNTFLILFDTNPNESEPVNLEKSLRIGGTRTYDRLMVKEDDLAELHTKIQNQIEKNIPVLVDDGTYGYLILGINKNDPENMYYIGDPHYGILYSHRDHSIDWQKNKPQVNSYGDDSRKIRWEPQSWFQGTGTQRKNWMLLFWDPSTNAIIEN